MAERKRISIFVKQSKNKKNMENTTKTHEENVQRIADNLDAKKKEQETRGVIQLVLLPVWIYIIYQLIAH